MEERSGPAALLDSSPAFREALLVDREKGLSKISDIFLGSKTINRQLPDLKAPDRCGCAPLSVAVAKGVNLEPKVTRLASLSLGWSFQEDLCGATFLPCVWRKAKDRGKNKVSDTDRYLVLFGIKALVVCGWETEGEERQKK